MQEQGSSNPAALLQQLQAAQGFPRQQALLMRMLQESVFGGTARDPLAARVLPAISLPYFKLTALNHCSAICLAINHKPNKKAERCFSERI